MSRKLYHAVLSILIAAAAAGVTPMERVQAEGYWTDGWTDPSGTWHDGFWTETGGGDGCGWVVDWNNPDGGYCSYVAKPDVQLYVENAKTMTPLPDGLVINALGYNVAVSADGDAQWIVDQPGEIIVIRGLPGFTIFRTERRQPSPSMETLEPLLRCLAAKDTIKDMD